MKTLILAAAAAGLAMCAAPAFAQAPNDAAATLRQGENYSKAKGLTPHVSSRAARHRTAAASKTGSADPDTSADQLNAKQLHGAGGS